VDKIDLADAIKALRDALVQAMWDGQRSQIRFRIEPVELTVNVEATRTGAGTGGVNWHILTLTGERSRQLQSAQTLKLWLTPVFLDGTGNEIGGELLVVDRANGESSGAGERPLPPGHRYGGT
jgi:hypothetical protein